MNPKEYLSQVRKYDRLINNKLETIASLRSLVTSVTIELKSDVVQSSGTKDKMASAVERIIDLEREIDRDIDQLVNLKREVMSVIDKIGDPVLIDILYKRYFRYEKWEEIAIEMNYSYRQVTRLHGQALQDVRKIIEPKTAESGSMRIRRYENDRA